MSFLKTMSDSQLYVRVFKEQKFGHWWYTRDIRTCVLCVFICWSVHIFNFFVLLLMKDFWSVEIYADLCSLCVFSFNLCTYACLMWILLKHYFVCDTCKMFCLRILNACRHHRRISLFWHIRRPHHVNTT